MKPYTMDRRPETLMEPARFRAMPEHGAERSLPAWRNIAVFRRKHRMLGGKSASD